MSRGLIIRPEAEVELAEAFAWYEERLTGLGAEFLLCIDAAFNAILRNPRQYPQVHGIVRRALPRRFPYEVFFLEDNESVVVLAVFHAKRNPGLWQERV